MTFPNTTKNTKIFRILTVTMILGIAVGVLAITPVRDAVADHIQDVFVTNDAAHPVPVSIPSSTTVNVGNSGPIPVSLAAGTTVNLPSGSTVNIGNTPVPITVQNIVTEQAKTQLFQFVDSPLAVSYPSFGEFRVPLGGSNIISTDGYRQVCVEAVESVGHTNTSGYSALMGKLSGSTLGTFIATNHPLGGTIDCYEVNGPEFALILNGSPNTSDSVQLWVYLRS